MAGAGRTSVVILVPALLDVDVPDEAGALETEKSSAGTPTLRKPKVRRGIRVGEATILRLAQAQAVPSGAPVAADWPRPPGLKLGEVGHLGLGVEDGDVLTEVMEIFPSEYIHIGGDEYELTGHKWFCSAPMCDAFLTLARTDIYEHSTEQDGNVWATVHGVLISGRMRAVATDPASRGGPPSRGQRHPYGDRWSRE